MGGTIWSKQTSFSSGSGGMPPPDFLKGSKSREFEGHFRTITFSTISTCFEYFYKKILLTFWKKGLFAYGGFPHAPSPKYATVDNVWLLSSL